jgi:predicted 3-demethylubiquinone-9 3-methyltransferase (glyoxalase superfamily)
MAIKASTFLMFEGAAEEAMNFYVALFAGSEINSVVRYGADGPGKEGSIMIAEFTLGGQRFLCSDSSVHHAFTFTPSVSIFVDFESEVQLKAAYDRLSEGGAVMMGLADYGFSRMFGWVADRFGVSWQLNLPHPTQ